MRETSKRYTDEFKKIIVEVYVNHIEFYCIKHTWRMHRSSYYNEQALLLIFIPINYVLKTKTPPNLHLVKLLHLEISIFLGNTFDTCKVEIAIEWPQSIFFNKCCLFSSHFIVSILVLFRLWYLHTLLCFINSWCDFDNTTSTCWCYFISYIRIFMIKL